MPDLRRLGREAEDRAAAFLIDAGFTIITRRYTVRGGEIDLIALDGDVLVFVEVKERSGRWTSPEESIDDLKVKHLSEAAERYLLDTEQVGRPFRFDLVAIDQRGIRHYPKFF
jgi:putative endonuclease